jgi:trehalose-6-phosphate synthase
VIVVLNNSHLFWRASFVVSLLSLHLIQFLDTMDFQGCVPVFLDDDTVDQYYNGYCNNVLWPLFHYIGLPQEDRLAATRSMDSQFNAYNHANQLFAEVVFSQYQVLDKHLVQLFHWVLRTHS